MNFEKRTPKKREPSVSNQQDVATQYGSDMNMIFSTAAAIAAIVSERQAIKRKERAHLCKMEVQSHGTIKMDKKRATTEKTMDKNEDTMISESIDGILDNDIGCKRSHLNDRELEGDANLTEVSQTDDDDRKDSERLDDSTQLLHKNKRVRVSRSLKPKSIEDSAYHEAACSSLDSDFQYDCNSTDSVAETNRRRQKLVYLRSQSGNRLLRRNRSSYSTSSTLTESSCIADEATIATSNATHSRVNRHNLQSLSPPTGACVVI